MKRRVKTLWQGKVALPDIQLKMIHESGEDLIITHDGKIMTIKNDEMKSRVVSRSEETFQDRYSKVKYRLCYYDWKPDPEVQKTLL